MRYVFISDVHGEFNKMIKALEEINFNKETDTLVSLGDPFDRGPDSYKVLEYLLSCPNRILIWGNHDLRLRELMLGDRVGSHDYHNGVLDTMKSFCGNSALNSIDLAINIFNTDDNYKDRLLLLWQYFYECHFAIEFSDLIGTHAWIPTLMDDKRMIYDKWGFLLTSKTYYRYDENWRETDYELWVDATWGHSQDLFAQKIFPPEKKLIIGHWHAWRLRLFASNGAVVYRKEEDIDFDTFEWEDKFVAIDGCTSLEGGKVNTWIYESAETPVLIDEKRIIFPDNE